MTARDRITKLVDTGSFHEYDMFVEHKCQDFGMSGKQLPGDGVITGTGTISGHPVCLYAQDFTVAGGSLGYMHAKKITKIMDHAMKLGVPIIGINDSGGARSRRASTHWRATARSFYRNTLASGVIPQDLRQSRPCAGGAVYDPALTDFVFVVRTLPRCSSPAPRKSRPSRRGDQHGGAGRSEDPHRW